MNTRTTRVLTLALAVLALAALAVPAGAFARGGTTTTVGAVNLFPDATAPGAKGRVLSNNQGTGSGIWHFLDEVNKLADGPYAGGGAPPAALDPTQAPTRITLNGFFSVVKGRAGFSAAMFT